MKFLTICILFPVIAAANPFVGRWSLSQISCASGAPVASPFHPQWDRVELEFYQDGTWSELNFVAGCELRVNGWYLFSPVELGLRSHQYYSSCGPVAVRPFQRLSYKMSLLNLDFSMRVNGGLCPAGDIVRWSFQRAHTTTP